MLDNKQIGEKINTRRRSLGFTLDDIARGVGVAASTIQRYESGRIATPKVPVLNSIASVLRVSPEWLYGTSDVKLPDNIIAADMSKMVQIPVIGRVAGGLACHAEQNVEGFEYVPNDVVCSGESYVYLRVIGDSMSPAIMEGDLVLVRCQPYLESGEYGVVLIDNEDGVVKRVYLEKSYIELVSENPYYPPRRFEGREMERIRIFGKVMESKRKF